MRPILHRHHAAQGGQVRHRSTGPRIAAALERALAGDARTRRPVPDLTALRGMMPMKDRPHFLTLE